MTRYLLSMTLAVWVGGCTKDHGGASAPIRLRDPDATGDSAAGRASTNERGSIPVRETDAAIPAVLEGSDTAKPASAPDAPAAAMTTSTQATWTHVWIGQLWSDEVPVCDPEHPENYANTTYTSVRTVLLVDSDANGALTGRIKFGDGVPPTDPGEAPYKDTQDPFWICSAVIPTLGVEYSLIDLRLDPGRMTFKISPNDTWTPWCETEMPSCQPDHCATFAGAARVCTCDGGDCHATRIQWINFDLAEVGDALEGTIPTGHSVMSSQLRLRRVQ